MISSRVRPSSRGIPPFHVRLLCRHDPLSYRPEHGAPNLPQMLLDARQVPVRNAGSATMNTASLLLYDGSGQVLSVRRYPPQPHYRVFSALARCESTAFRSPSAGHPTSIPLFRDAISFLLRLQIPENFLSGQT